MGSHALHVSHPVSASVHLYAVWLLALAFVLAPVLALPPLNHQLSPWYMQLREKEGPAVHVSSLFGPQQHQQPQQYHNVITHNGSGAGSAGSQGTRRYASELVGGGAPAASQFCVEPTRDIYEQFVAAYNRSWPGSYDELERRKLFEDTYKRVIVLNNIIESSLASVPHQQAASYHYVRANELWYADINDCELAYIKSTVSKIFELVDQNEYGLALANMRQVHQDYPIMSGDAMKQACQILLVRLHDRAHEEWVHKWFGWELYFKKLAAYNYNLHQLQAMAQWPNQQQQAWQSQWPPEGDADGLAGQLELYAFIYPKFYKDIRFNDATLNKTHENAKILRDFLLVNDSGQKKTAQLSAQEKNERIDVFRRRWTMAKLINDRITNSNQFNPALATVAGSNGLLPNRQQVAARNKNTQGHSQQLLQQQQQQNSLVILNRFSDLSDEELVAYVNDDPSYVRNNTRSIDYYRQFPLVVLNNDTKLELVNEMLLRRRPNNNWSLADKLAFANELVSDLGLPVGSRTEPVLRTETDQLDYQQVAQAAFQQVSAHFNKSYLTGSQQQQHGRSAVDLAQERDKRLATFANNFARIRAWQLKEGWHLSDSQSLAMLRLADVTWDELKLTLLRLCCLSGDQARSLAAFNTTIRYLLSLQVCQTPLQRHHHQQEWTHRNSVSQEEAHEQQQLSALELYYYYIVHYSRHHPTYQVHRERFLNFRRNLADLSRYHCERNLVLYSLLERNKLPAHLDDKVLDDMSLDRFLYFDLDPAGSGTTGSSSPAADADTTGSNSNNNNNNKNNRNNDEVARWFGGRERDTPYPGRAGTITTYNQDNERFFGTLYDSKRRHQMVTAAYQPATGTGNWPLQDIFGGGDRDTGYQSASNGPLGTGYSDKLVVSPPFPVAYHGGRGHGSSGDGDGPATGPGRIYNFVSNRYRLCQRMTDQGYATDSVLAQCRPFASSEELERAAGSGQLQSLTTGYSQRFVDSKDKCAFYKLGLEPYPSGLRSVQVPDESASVISRATCKRQGSGLEDWTTGAGYP